MKRGASTRLAAAEAILELAQSGVDLVAVSADTSKSMFTTLLRDAFPERCVDTGIAEQNMMMVAAGIASTGKVAFALSYSVFASMRCCEQLRTFIAYPRLNVKVIAGIGGFSAGIEGVTHTATEDLGIVRCIAGMVVMAPSDAVTTKMAVKASVNHQGPVYIRVGREASPVLFDDSYPFEIGVPVVLRQGKDVTLLGTGLVVAEVLEAAERLASRGVQAGVVEVHTLKPLSRPSIILEQALATGKVVTIEEHNVVGGLGTVVSEILAGVGPIQITKLGLQDTFAESGTPEELLRKYGVNAEGIVQRVMKSITGGEA